MCVCLFVCLCVCIWLMLMEVCECVCVCVCARAMCYRQRHVLEKSTLGSHWARLCLPRVQQKHRMLERTTYICSSREGVFALSREGSGVPWVQGPGAFNASHGAKDRNKHKNQNFVAVPAALQPHHTKPTTERRARQIWPEPTMLRASSSSTPIKQRLDD